MGEHEDVAAVKTNIQKIFNRRKRAALALCLSYAAQAVQYIRTTQATNAFWQNQTGIAKDSIFGGSINNKYEIGWFIAHGVSYGVYLEIANNRKHAVLLPTIARYYSRFIRDFEKVFNEAAVA
jgi:hypothetical protein